LEKREEQKDKSCKKKTDPDCNTDRQSQQRPFLPVLGKSRARGKTFREKGTGEIRERGKKRSSVLRLFRVTVELKKNPSGGKGNGRDYPEYQVFEGKVVLERSPRGKETTGKRIAKELNKSKIQGVSPKKKTSTAGQRPNS